MMRNLIIGAFSIFSLATLVATQAFAQLQDPSYYTESALGVDLRSGNYMSHVTDLTIGQGGNGLSFSRNYLSGARHVGSMGKGWIHDFEIVGYAGISWGIVAGFSFSMGDQVETMQKSSLLAPFKSERRTVGQLEGGSIGDDITYFSPDGTKIVFQQPSGWSGVYCLASDPAPCRYEATLIEKPNGEQLTLTYKNLDGSSNRRLISVNSTLGWNLSFGYSSAATGRRLEWVQATNLAEQYCADDQGQPYCGSQNGVWKRVKFDYDTATNELLETVDDNNDDLVVTYGYDSNDRLTTIQKSSSAAADLTNVYNTDGQVQSQTVRADYTNDGGGGAGTLTGQWTYAYTDTQTTVTNPQSHTTITHFPSATALLPDWTRDALNRTTSYQHDANRRLTRITAPQGNYTQFTYNSKGNVTEVRQVAKSGSGLTDIVVEAGYTATCDSTNYKYCNEPLWTKDALGNQTDYTYSQTYGGVTEVQAPAPGAGHPNATVRPISYVKYALKSAKKETSGGGTVALPGVYVVERQFGCRTLGSCAWTDADAEGVEYGYTIPIPVGSDHFNLLPTQMRVDPNGLNLTDATSYDRYGNVVTVDGVYAGSDDTTQYYYDDLNRPIGAIGPDPDGASGPRKRPAGKTTYVLQDRLPWKQEVGATANQDATFPTGASFDVLNYTTVHRDSLGRVISSRIKTDTDTGPYTHAASQVRYNNDGTVDCSQFRMNPAAIQGAIAGYCSASTAGTYGPDRISETNYDAADQVLSAKRAVGTSLEQFAARYTYTTNGRLATIQDAEGALTTYEYDGHDRLKTIRYPRPDVQAVSATANGSPTDDYETFTYNANGQVLTYRRRDGQIISYEYDDLGRVTKKDLPGTALDEFYFYDNFGRPTAVRLASATSTDAITYTYDKAGRILTETSYGRQMRYDYYDNGKRTRLTWPDSFYVEYLRDTLGRIIEIRENGAGTGPGLLITYTYDDYGRRIETSRGNGTRTDYDYDGLSRLTLLRHDLSGIIYDSHEEFSYSPASEITEHEYVSGAGRYLWWPAVDETNTYQNNYLNQVTDVNGTAVTYSDDRGNITGIGSNSYGYDILNRLTSATVDGKSTTLSYDPAGRLHQETTSVGTTTFLYGKKRGKRVEKGGKGGQYIFNLQHLISVVAGQGFWPPMPMTTCSAAPRSPSAIIQPPALPMSQTARSIA